jgi:hypothetical protein
MAEITMNGKTYLLKCGMTDCEHELHSFNSNKTLQAKGIEKGCCVNCRSTLVDWPRVHKMDVKDIDYAISALHLEMIRNIFWSVKEPTEQMLERIGKLSHEELEDAIRKRLIQTLSKPKSENIYDGRQTPFESNNIIHWAQHATGTCCRKCLEEWYGIDANSIIEPENYQFLISVIQRYIDLKTANANL